MRVLTHTLKRWAKVARPSGAGFLKIPEEARRKYRFVVHGYVVMPEHFHRLITEPEVGDPSVVMKVIKARFSRRVNGGWAKISFAARTA